MKWRYKRWLKYKEQCNNMIDEQVNVIIDNIQNNDNSLDDFLGFPLHYTDKSKLTNVFFLLAVVYRVKKLIGYNFDLKSMIDDYYLDCIEN